MRDIGAVYTVDSRASNGMGRRSRDGSSGDASEPPGRQVLARPIASRGARDHRLRVPAQRSRSPRDGTSAPALATRYARVRRFTERLAAPLSAEDAVVQSMPEASPTKWHLAHTSWFFEALVLRRVDPSAPPYGDPRWGILFNSYYDAIGPQHERARRGMLTRPSLDEVYAYRRWIDERVTALLARLDAVDGGEVVADLVTLGIEHERQHQELLLTDALDVLAQNPLAPAYRARSAGPRSSAPPLAWIEAAGGVCTIGADGATFAYDNERPRHRVVVEAFALASRLVTNGEYAAFLDDGGYERSELWLADGWASAKSGGWRAPLRWRRRDGAWWAFGFSGLEPIDADAPVAHVSYYEADAFARWAGARLPTEAEWEVAASALPVEGNFVESGLLAPAVAVGAGLRQVFGDAWEWTSSPYVPYPGFRPFDGAAREYNGKFMCNQMVLRGGSCLTSAEHVRATYRSFFPPPARWQMTGIRLARPA